MKKALIMKKELLIKRRRNLLKSIRYFEKKLDKAFGAMDFEAYCNYSATIGQRYRQVEILNEAIVNC